MAAHSSTLTISLLVMFLFSTLSSASDMSIKADDVLLCDLTSWCPLGSTCCCIESPYPHICSAWACCPYEGATCCPDHKHCCRPDFPVCHNDEGKCKLRMGNPLGVKVMNFIPAEPVQALGKSRS